MATRFPALAPEQLDEAQQSLLASAGAAGGGPFQAMLRSPELAAAARDVRLALRAGALPAAIQEMAILATAAAAGCRAQYDAHVTLAGKAGLAPAAIAAAANDDPLPPELDAEDLVRSVCRGLVLSHRLSDRDFAAASARFGDRGVAELIGFAGFYGWMAMVMNASRPDQEEEE